MENISIIDHTGVKSGLDKYSTSFAESLAKLNYGVNVFSNYVGEHSDNVKYFTFFEAKRTFFVKRFFLRLAGYFKSAICSRKNVKFIFIHLFELTFISFLQHLICYYWGKGDIVTIYHDIDAFGNRDIKFLGSLILKKYSRIIIVHNEFSKRELLRLFPYVDKSKIIIMKHGHYNDFIFDVTTPQKEVVDINQLKNSGKNIVLFFGQIKEEKGLDILIKSLASINENVILIIAGKPVVDFQVYNNLIQQLGLNNRVITYLRFIEDIEMNYLIQNADLVVLPYRKIFQSGVLLNVLSQRALVLASDLEPNKEIIKDGENGFLFASESVESLSQQLKKILSYDLNLLNKIKFNGWSYVTNEYDWNHIVALLLQNLNELNHGSVRKKEFH